MFKSSSPYSEERSFLGGSSMNVRLTYRHSHRQGRDIDTDIDILRMVSLNICWVPQVDLSIYSSHILERLHEVGYLSLIGRIALYGHTSPHLPGSNQTHHVCLRVPGLCYFKSRAKSLPIYLATYPSLYQGIHDASKVCPA